MKNLLVAQSGGPTSAINATLAGVVENALSSPSVDKIYGSINGIQGVLTENLVDLKTKITNVSELDLLCQTPASALGSCRVKLKDPAVCADEYETIISVLRKYNIDCFIYIGGNDSMDTVDKLSKYLNDKGISDITVVGAPKTIDNDLCGTDHCPGFGSAAKYIGTTFAELERDCHVYSTKAVTIVEVMGRDAGWLTAASALARNEYNVAPHLIYLPEAPFDKDDFLLDVKKMLFTCNNVIVAVSEGIRDREGNYISASEQSVDTFGHSQLSGAGKTLEFLVKEKLGVKVRSVELNVLQRCASHLASKTDLEEAFALGKKAVALAEQNITASMVTMNRTSNNPYTIEYGYAEIKNIANEAKSVPREWINDAGNDIEQPLVDYLTPLIQGESQVQYKNGLPAYLNVSHLAELQ